MGKRATTPPPLHARLAAIVEPAKLPPLIDLAATPRLVLTSGAELDEASYLGVLRAIVARKLSESRLGASIRAETTRESGDALALHLLELWQSKEFHGRYDWALGAMTELGGDRTALALEAHVPAWPATSDTGRRRAIAALRVFRAIGTDTALMVLMGLRQKAVVPSVLEAAIDELEAATEERGLTVSELADRITPDCGLDARGMRALRYGARELTVGFDQHFEPRIHDASGPLDALPPPLPGDDPSAIEAARLTWSVLSAQLAEAVKVQSFRLEQDMVGGRRWDAETWTRCLKRHPLMVSFTRRLLWGLYDKSGALATGFRTAEDETLVDVDDAIFELPKKGARIGLVHPLHMTDEVRARWTRHFADYEIISPFPQLDRSIHRVLPAEAGETNLVRLANERFRSGNLRDTLVRRGWVRDPSPHRMYYRRRFAGDRVVAYARLDPGVFAGMATYSTYDQKVPSIDFKTRSDDKQGTSIELGAVPPVAFSEALLDVLEVLNDQELSPTADEGS